MALVLQGGSRHQADLEKGAVKSRTSTPPRAFQIL
jgi:hypothetical protein